MQTPTPRHPRLSLIATPPTHILTPNELILLYTGGCRYEKKVGCQSSAANMSDALSVDHDICLFPVYPKKFAPGWVGECEGSRLAPCLNSHLSNVNEREIVHFAMQAATLMREHKFPALPSPKCFQRGGSVPAIEKPTEPRNWGFHFEAVFGDNQANVVNRGIDVFDEIRRARIPSSTI